MRQAARTTGGRANLVMIAACVAAGVGLPASLSWSQQPTQTGAPTSVTALTSEQRGALARALTRVGVRDLRRQASPDANDFQIAAVLFEMATKVDPQPEVIRRWIDAADTAGDEAGVERATRQLIVADPNDTVAQLRLIATHLRRSQTAQERLAATVRLAKPSSGAKAIDASVRSRLALDGALLAREMGDDKQFVELLTLAAQLDPTNKDAAVLALSYAMAGEIAPAEQMELMSNVLLADPLDLAAHRAVRDLLASVGAYAQAQRFQSTMQRIQTVSGMVLENADRVEQLAIQWRMKGAGTVVESLNQDLSAARYQQSRIFESTKADVQDLRRPEEVRLSLMIEELRLASALAIDNAEGIKVSMTEMAASVTDLRARLASQATPDAQGTAQVQRAEWTLAMWQLLANHETEALKPRVEELLAIARDEGSEESMRGWMRARGVLEGNVTGHTTKGGEDAWGVMLSAFLAGDDATGKAQKASFARSLEASQPLTALGSLAGDWAQKAEPGYRHPSRDAVEREARAIPSWVDSMSTSPYLFQRVTIEPQRAQAGALEPVAFELIVRNLASVPLGVGEGRAIDSRFLIGPTLQVGNVTVSSQLVAEVVGAGSRLRLGQGEQLRTMLWMDDTPVGWLSGSGSRNPQVLRLRALQGFVTDSEGLRRAGPGCLDSSSGPLTRVPLPQSALETDQLGSLIATIGAGSFEDFRGLMVACRSRLLTAGEVEQPQALLTIGEALAKAYGAWTATQKQIALSELPTVHDLPVIAMNESVGMAAFDAAASAETDPEVLTWVLVTRVHDGASPAFAAAEKRPELSGLVSAMRSRFAAPDGAPPISSPPLSSSPAPQALPAQPAGAP
jgi:hypothetical protein